MIIFDFGILTATASALIHHRTVVVDLVKALLATQRIYNWNVTIVMNAIISNWHGLRIIVVIGTRWMRWRCYIRIRIIMWIHCYWGGQLDGFYIYTRWMTKQNENQKKNCWTESNPVRTEPGSNPNYRRSCECRSIYRFVCQFYTAASEEMQQLATCVQSNWNWWTSICNENIRQE